MVNNYLEGRKAGERYGSARFRFAYRRLAVGFIVAIKES